MDETKFHEPEIWPERFEKSKLLPNGRDIEVSLEAREDPADFIGAPQIGHGIGDCVVFQTQQRREFFLIEFLHADGDIVLQNEVEECLLFGREGGVDVNAGIGGADFAGERRLGVSDMGEHIEEVARLGVDDSLHLRELVVAEAFFCEPL